MKNQTKKISACQQSQKCGKHIVCCSPAVATNFLLPDCIRTVAGGKGERKERAKKRPPLYWRIKKGKGEEEGGKGEVGLANRYAKILGVKEEMHVQDLMHRLTGAQKKVFPLPSPSVSSLRAK